MAQQFGTIEISEGAVDGLDLSAAILAELGEADFSGGAPIGTVRILDGNFITNSAGASITNSTAFPDGTYILIENFGMIAGYGGAGGNGEAGGNGSDGAAGSAGDAGLAAASAKPDDSTKAPGIMANGGPGGRGGLPGKGGNGGTAGTGLDGGDGQNAIELTIEAGAKVEIVIDNEKGKIYGGGGGGGAAGGVGGSKGGDGNAIGGKGGDGGLGGAGAISVAVGEGTDQGTLGTIGGQDGGVASQAYKTDEGPFEAGAGGQGGAGGDGAAGGGGGGGAGGSGGHGGFPLGDGGDAGAGGTGGTGSAGAADGYIGDAGYPGEAGTIYEGNYDYDNAGDENGEEYDEKVIEAVAHKIRGGKGGNGADIGTAGTGGTAGTFGDTVAGAGEPGAESDRVAGDAGEFPTIVIVYQGLGGGPGQPGKAGRVIVDEGDAPIGKCGRGGKPGLAIKSGGARIKFKKKGNVKGLVL